MTEKSTKDDQPRRRVLRSFHDNSPMKRFLGGLAVGSFVVVWLSSILSPALFAWIILADRKGLLTLLSILLAMAYTPWKRGIVSQTIAAFFDRFHILYYNSYKLVMHHDPFEPLSGSQDDEGKEAPKRRKLFYAIHPHGAFSLDKPTMISYMKAGMDLALPPGGFEEATLTSLRNDRVYIQNRKGFVKLCLQHGYHIVPVYCFGENKTYWNLQGGWKFRIGVLNQLGLPAILVWGLPLLPLVPRYSVDLHVVAGPPLQLPLIPEPSREEVQEWHTKYMRALEELYDGYKDEYYGGTDTGSPHTLELW